VRETAESYETYDAFCRVAMSTGTCSLATFLCYFCLTYVLTEDASPAPAWTGMMAYCAIALVLLRLDMKLKGHEYYILSFLMIVPPLICGFVTFVNSKGKGTVGNIEYVMPLVPLLHGLWYVYYLWMFQVIELENGAMLPAAFGSVLYLDAFGWAARQPQSRSATPSSTECSDDGDSRTYIQSARDWLYGVQPKLPSMRVLDPRVPSRPGDAEQEQEALSSRRTARRISQTCTGFGTIVESHDKEVERHQANVPWNTYRWSTMVMAFLWTVASVANSYNLARGNRDYEWFNRFTDLKRGHITHGEVRMLQQSQKVITKYVSLLTRPRGLSCDPLGKIFVTSGLDSDGQKSLLHSRLSDSGVNFQSLSHCLLTEDVMEDVTLHRCSQQDEDCAALFLPREGERFTQCSLPGDALSGTESSAKAHGVFTQTGSASSMTLPLHRAWLDDRGASPLESSPFEDSTEEVDDHPEEISAVIAVPCGANIVEQCIVVGTTARRVVLLAAKQMTASATGPAWVPRRILSNDVGEVPGPGAFALLGDRHLGVLLRGIGHLRLLDLHNGGNHTADLQLPKEQHWASVCAGGNSIFALEHGDDPSLWQFAAPSNLVSRNGNAAVEHIDKAAPDHIDKASSLALFQTNARASTSNTGAASHSDAALASDADSSSFFSSAVSVISAASRGSLAIERLES